MADAAEPTKIQGHNNTRREREFRRYAEAIVGLKIAQDGDTAISSADVSLTAFAQLVCLRLDARRVLISLFDSARQYILAEATPTLSLQRDAVHDSGDEMFFGKSILPRGPDWFDETLNLACSSALGGGVERDAALQIPDLREDERYAKHHYVVGRPHVRSFIGVPLQSRSGFAIGLVAILDDRPRPSALEPALLQHIRDVSTSIVAHLDHSRLKLGHQRGTRMIRALSQFLEGATALDDALLNDSRATVPAQQVNGTESASDEPASNRELSPGAQPRLPAGILDDEVNTKLPRAGVAARAQSNAHVAARSRRASHPSLSGAGRGKKTKPQDNTTGGSQPSASQLQENAISRDIARAFDRAASLIREATDVSGVMFLDASAGEFGSFRSRSSPDGSSESSFSSTRHSSVTSVQNPSTIQSEVNTAPPRTKNCRYLSAAYAPETGGMMQHRGIPEKFLRSLQRRFPYGKIFNFGEGRLLSSDEQSGLSDSQHPEALQQIGLDPEVSEKRKRRADSDAHKLLKIFPGLKSFMLVPLWDSQKNQFFAAAVAWSYNPSRLFSYQDDFNYLSAFCDVLMAESQRLNIQAEARAKSGFISSISHELRSPLHGILGSVEFLQEDAEDPAARQQLISMIDLCGRSLLDIINNLLDHAHNMSTDKARALQCKVRPNTSVSSDSVVDLAVVAEEVLDSALWNTPQPTARGDDVAPSDPSAANNETLKVILELETRGLPANTGWHYHINVGAYRRILQNLVVNAMKYTDKGGYCKLRLSKLNERGRTSMIEIECKDSGRGMSDKFLRTGLWKAFSQENTYAVGTGLGLSLVRSLVEDMGGTINVSSTQHVGTCVKVHLPLLPGITGEGAFLESDDARRVKGLTFGLVGFDATSEQVARASEATDFLRLSSDTMFRYLGLQQASGTVPDFTLITERRALAADTESEPTIEELKDRRCIVLCDSVHSSRTTSARISKTMPRATAMAQPIGPRQLLQALISCIESDKLQRERQLRESVLVQPTVYNAEPTPASEMSDFAWGTTAPAAQDAADTEHPPAEVETRRFSTPASTRPSLSKEHSSVLLVDDNHVNAVLLQRYMKRLDREQTVAYNGLEAVQAYQRSHGSQAQIQDQEQQPTSPTSPPVSPFSDPGVRSSIPSTATKPISIIFMDITMPVMDGLEATRRIRSYERSAGLKPAMIVALTALASPQARQEAYSSGVDLFLTKPVRFKDIEQMFADFESDSTNNE